MSADATWPSRAVPLSEFPTEGSFGSDRDDHDIWVYNTCEGE